jgi:hypothetical protein
VSVRVYPVPFINELASSIRNAASRANVQVWRHHRILPDKLVGEVSVDIQRRGRTGGLNSPLETFIDREAV